MGQIKFITSLMFVVLLTIAIVSYTINFGEDNNAVVKLGDYPDFNTLKTLVWDSIRDYVDKEMPIIKHNRKKGGKDYGK